MLNPFPIKSRLDWDKPSWKWQLGLLSYELIIPSLAFMTQPQQTLFSR